MFYHVADYVGDHAGTWEPQRGLAEALGWGGVGGSGRLKGETLMQVASASPPAEAPSPGPPAPCRSPCWWLDT